MGGKTKSYGGQAGPGPHPRNLLGVQMPPERVDMSPDIGAGRRMKNQATYMAPAIK